MVGWARQLVSQSTKSLAAQRSLFFGALLGAVLSLVLTVWWYDGIESFKHRLLPPDASFFDPQDGAAVDRFINIEVELENWSGRPAWLVIQTPSGKLFGQPAVEIDGVALWHEIAIGSDEDEGETFTLRLIWPGTVEAEVGLNGTKGGVDLESRILEIDGVRVVDSIEVTRKE